MKMLATALCLILCLVPNMAQSEEISRREMFVSVIERPLVLASRLEMDKLIDFSTAAKIKVLYVQIYRANQAWFPSKIGDTTPYENCFYSVGEDPFALLIRKAHAAGIEVHAWINLLSLAKNTDAPLLRKYGPSILTKNLRDKQTLDDYRIDEQFFLEPGDPRVREELAGLIEEVVETYPDLDGLQFDYIRYPDKDPNYGFTKANVARFKAATGITTIEQKSQAWQDWKRDQVTELLSILIKRAHALRPELHMSTTGCVTFSRAFNEAFQDWASWVNSGLIEYVTIMSYPDNVPELQKHIADAQKRVKDLSKVHIGLGVYKLVDFPEIFKQQLILCEQTGDGACVFFYYGNMSRNPSLAKLLTDTLL